MTISRRPIPLLVDGTAVAAATTNRPLEAISSQLAYLLSRINAIEAAGGSYVKGAAAASTLLVGQPAYFNPLTMAFEQALGDATVDADSGELVPRATAYVRGIVTAKPTATTADVLLVGAALVDMSHSISGTPTVGSIYYLSNSTAGRLVAQRPAIGIPVLQMGALQTDGTYEVFVSPQFADYLNQHRHYSYSLVCAPAGSTSPPAYDERHTITVADSDAEGWLPADDPVFDGQAPSGAVFGYNIAQSPLANLWPPVPLTSVCIEVVREDGVAAGMGVTVPLGSDQLCVVDQNGIWWMSDCYGEAPWPTALDTAVADSTSISDGVVECPRDVPMSMKVFFVRQSFLGGNTAVLSLRPVEGSGLTVRCAGQINDATTGHLEIDFSLAAEVTNDDEPGYLAFKAIDGNQFKRGPVVSAVRAGAGNVTVVGTGPTVSVGGRDYATGALTLSVDQGLADTELSIETLRLESVLDIKYDGILALSFPQSRTSSFRGRICVPSKDVLPEGAQVKLRFWLAGRVAGTIPDDALTVTYRVLSQPTSPTALPSSDASLALDTSAVLSAADMYYEVSSSPIDITAGDVVLFTVTRASDAYAGDILMIRQTGVIVEPE